jgi:phosphoribosylformimino-5-aminoimidazole carboxamide ribotide isomerase
MIGPNITQTASIANSVRIPIIASGGIASIKDLINLKKSCSNLNGIISGRAIYEKTLGLKEAINLLKDGEGA